MMYQDDIVFLFDCDNTLLDNDRVKDDLRMYLQDEFGNDARDRCWTLFERLRSDLGYADYLEALQHYRLEAMADMRLLKMYSFLADYPFQDRVYPGALDAIAYCRAFSLTVILTDGDVVFQPRKIQHSGLWDAVEGRVLIHIHKEQMLHEVERHYPALHYVMIDDKLRILAAMKEKMEDRVTTVFPRQGHYAFDTDNLARYSAADLTVERIGDLTEITLSTLLGTAHPSTKIWSNYENNSTTA